MAIRFGVSDQLVSSDLFSHHGGGGAEDGAPEGEGGRIDRTRRAKQAQTIDSKMIAVSQAAVGTVDSK